MEKDGDAPRFRQRIFRGLYPKSAEKELLDFGAAKEL
jgi:hypothetical protein